MRTLTGTMQRGANMEELSGIVEEWLQEHGVDCRDCKYGKKSRFDEKCRDCVNNIGIILNFEAIKK